MKAFIICSLRSIEIDYFRLIWVRSQLLYNRYNLNEDWINYKLNIVDNKPRFKQTPGFDYLKTAIDSIKDADLIVIFLSVESAYTATLLRYAHYQNKKIILIYRYKKHLSRLYVDNISGIHYIPSRSYKKLTQLL